MRIKDPSATLHPLEIKVRETIREHAMVAPGDHVLVAASGGADSTALLLCLCRLSADLNISLTVGHLNHRIREAEADADEDFVRRMSSDLGLPFVSERVEVKLEAAAAKRNLEDLARQRRYDFLSRTAQRVEANRIAVGHTMNDQAETILFRFIRGSGIEGLSAIHPVVDGLVIRPMLECSRAAILAYLKQREARYREDSSNKDIRHARNRIRRELLPYLENNLNPKLVPTLAREALLARETWSFMESQAKQAFAGLQNPMEGGISLKIRGLLEFHPALQKLVLREALRACLGSLRGITSLHIQSVLALCRPGHSGDQIRMPSGCTAIRQFDSLLLLKHTPQPGPAFVYSLSIPGQCFVAEAKAIFRCAPCGSPDWKALQESGFTKAFLEPSVLPQVLTIRSRLPGDRYGGHGHRKVKKLLIDCRIPRLQRSSLPMVAAGNEVIWIPGFRPASAYAAQPGSPMCVLLEMIPESRIQNSARTP